MGHSTASVWQGIFSKFEENVHSKPAGLFEVYSKS